MSFILRRNSTVTNIPFKLFNFILGLLVVILIIIYMGREWIQTGIPAGASTVNSAGHLVMMAATNAWSTRLPFRFATTPYHIHEVLWAWGWVEVTGAGTPSFISHPYLVMSRSGGPNWSADLASIVWRWARKICRKRFSSVGGSDMSFRGLPHFLVYNRYLASPMVVPAGWPYRIQKNPYPTSNSCACVAPCSPNTECRPGKSPALKVLRPDTFPFPYRYEVVSEPVR